MLLRHVDCGVFVISISPGTTRLVCDIGKCKGVRRQVILLRSGSWWSAGGRGLLQLCQLCSFSLRCWVDNNNKIWLRVFINEIWVLDGSLWL